MVVGLYGNFRKYRIEIWEKNISGMIKKLIEMLGKTPKNGKINNNIRIEVILLKKQYMYNIIGFFFIGNTCMI